MSDRAAFAPDPRRRAFVTPEGVDLGMEVGALGARVAALAIDLLIQSGLLIALTLLTLAAAGAARLNGLAGMVSLWMLGAFAVRNGYFLLFELGPRAATPGKRLQRLRVASRDGSRLTAEAVFARNVMRETELFLPLTFLVTAGTRENWAVGTAGLLWTVGFGLLPLFNRDRLRAGDLVAGTWVVAAPRPKLLADLSAAADAEIGFTDRELALYGEAELRVLEAVIRRKRPEAVRDVARRIRRRLDRAPAFGERDLDFLQAFYAAQRAKLERDLLLGRRKLSQAG